METILQIYAAKPD